MSDEGKPLWIVTGGSSGMGHAVANRALASGADVIVWDIQKPALVAVAWECVDLSDPDQVANTADKINSPLAAFVHCAGVIRQTNLADPEMVSKFESTMRLHTVSFLIACQRLADRLSDARGSIVAIASIAAEDVMSGSWLAYGASKAALWRSVREISLELAPRGVRVNAIAPGAIMTPMSRAGLEIPEFEARWLRGIPMGRIGEPDEIASVVEFFVSPMSSYVTGQLLRVDGGIMSGSFAGLMRP